MDSLERIEKKLDLLYRMLVDFPANKQMKYDLVSSCQSDSRYNKATAEYAELMGKE